MPAMEGLARSLTVVEELAVARRVGEVQRARPRVPAPLVVGPRARRRELAAGPPRQETCHRRRGLAHQKALHTPAAGLSSLETLSDSRSNNYLKLVFCYLGDLAHHVVALLAPCLSGRSPRRHRDEEDVKKQEHAHRPRLGP